MYQVYLHKDAQKVLKKAQKSLKLKAIYCLQHLEQYGLENIIFKIDTLKGEFKKHKYFEIKLTGDFRLIVRRQNRAFYIRYAGTHNQLGTG